MTTKRSISLLNNNLDQNMEKEIVNDFINLISSNMWENKGHLENFHFNYPKINVLKRKLDNENIKEYVTDEYNLDNLDDGSVEYYIQLQCPNAIKEYLKVQIQDTDTLIIEGKTNLENMMGNIKNYRFEHSEFKIKKDFKRKLIIPNIIKNSVRVNFNDGLLEIKLISGKRNTITNIDIN